MQSTHNTLRSLTWNPLEFCKVNGYLYPHVSNTMLELPAISVASKRVFSTAGNIISGQRESLTREC